ncbi:unnamed protein product, partial [Owenia fusiformis]
IQESTMGTIRFILFYMTVGVAVAIPAEECPSTIPEASREDCYPEGGASKETCNSRGCLWCETTYQGPPWCFFDPDIDPRAGCNSPINELDRVDCYPEPGSSEGLCLGRGCLWCASQINGVPYCFYDTANTTTTVATTTTAGSGTTTTAASTTPAPGDQCFIPEANRQDCYPEAGASESGCYSRGCLWCPTGEGSTTPWCHFNDTSGTPPPTTTTIAPPGQNCTVVGDPAQRIDCMPAPADQQGCIDKGCYWCEYSDPNIDVPWCYFDSSSWPPAIDEDDRVDCSPGVLDTDACIARGCLLGQRVNPNAPVCYYDSTWGYRIVGAVESTTKGYRVNLEKSDNGTMYGQTITNVIVDVEFHTTSRLRVKFYDANNARFEVPLDIDSPSTAATNTLYDVQFSDTPVFSFKVIRKNSGEMIFDTSVGGFTFEDQFLQIATWLPSKTLYGFGETEHHSFLHENDWNIQGYYSRDQPPAYKGNLYGVHPFYEVVENDFQTHGVLILNSNAQDVTVTPKSLIFRTIGGVLDLYIFLGPSPENVIQQYTTAIGLPFMPPYWSLGFQLSRYGYDSITTMRATVDRIKAYNIPLDVQYGDIDYFDRRLDFTYDTVNYAGMPDYVRQLKAEGTKFVTILDPCISIGEPAGTYPPFDRGQVQGVWVNNSDGVTPAEGRVWPPDNVYFPDYTNPATEPWWTQECVDFHQTIEFDGIWIDMNEPANFMTGGIEGCVTSTVNNPPYFPAIWGNVLADKSLCPDFRQYGGSHYDVHSLYGWSQSPPTMRAARTSANNRGFVVSRSTFPGSGKWAAHWLGDNYSQWTNLHYSIIGMLEFNLFGIPYIGADICGFNGDSTASQCQRWMQLGAFYTFSRNHNGKGYREQDPGAWGDEVARVSREALAIRYTILPYLYTLFYRVHTQGGTIIRPVMHEFVQDNNTHNIDRQFLWGPAFLITPVLDQDAVTVNAYFPDARWYSYYDGGEIAQSDRKNNVLLNAPMDVIPLHIRGGYILPTQDPATTTMASRTNAMGLIVALDDAMAASGELFWDDGETLDTHVSGDYFMATYEASMIGQYDGLLVGTVNNQGYITGLTLDSIRIMGLGLSTVSEIRVNNFKHDSWTQSGNGEVTITLLNLPLDSNFDITWTQL